MGQKLTTGFQDINGDGSNTRFWVNDAANALGALQNMANLSNAAIVSAWMGEVVDLTALGLKAAAVAANVETARTKLKVHLSGPDAGSVANPRADVTLSIPAPVGDLLNANGPNTAALTPFIALVRADSDVAMDRIDRVYYSKSR